MSYNIDSHEVLAGAGLTLTGAQIATFRELEELPEIHPFYDLPEVLEPERAYEITPHWAATWSGHSFEDLLLKVILPATKGEADILYTWEGGDSFSGIRVRDGVVTEHEVVMTLGKELER